MSGWRTALLVTGIILGALAVVDIMAALTKTACPFVYVEDGTGYRFVGEAYSGATSRVTQREDLLPLPSLGLRPRMVLSNEAQETQFTDLLEVVVVDRATGKRAMATHDARLVVVGEARAPRAATDLGGKDVLDLVRDEDGLAWQTDLDAVARRQDASLREGIIVALHHRPAGALWRCNSTPATLRGSTSCSVDSSRSWAIDSKPTRTEPNEPGSREPTLAWREREGVDLRVEVERGKGWERVAVVPTVGPASRRRFAVPMGPATGDEVRVRLSGGVGFWQADRVALVPSSRTALPSGDSLRSARSNGRAPTCVRSSPTRTGATRSWATGATG